MPKTSVVMSRLLSRGHRPGAGRRRVWQAAISGRNVDFPARLPAVLTRGAVASLVRCSPSLVSGSVALGLAAARRAQSRRRRGRAGAPAGAPRASATPTSRSTATAASTSVLRRPRRYRFSHRPALRLDPSHAAHHPAAELVRPRLPAAGLGGAPVDRAATFSRPTTTSCGSSPRHPIAAGTTVRVTRRLRRPPRAHSYAGREQLVGDRARGRGGQRAAHGALVVPGNDHPLDKARMDVHVTVPGDQAGRVQRPSRRRTPARRRATYHWGGGGPMATYLAFFVAGRFAIRQGTAHHLPYYLAVSRALPPGPRGAAMRGLRQTPAIVHWLQQPARPYPFARTGGVVTRARPRASPWRTRPARSTRAASAGC